MASFLKSDPNRAVVALDDIRVTFGETVALDIPRLRVEEGERIFVLGKSGSGKTTLSRLLKGRLRPAQGRARVLGIDPSDPSPGTGKRLQRGVAMVDQEFNLVPRLSVVGNVLTGALGRVSPWSSLLGWYPQAEWTKAESILAEVELEGLGGRRVETLSGGQRQRTAIARALMQEAGVILADEPVSNLDPELAEDALDLLVSCTQSRDVTLIVNLHQPRLARKFATRVIGLLEGRVVYDGSPEKLSEDAEEFIYSGNSEEDGAVPAIRSTRDRTAETMAT